MTITTKLAVAIASATLAACGGGGETNNVDTLEVNTMMTDNVGATDMNMGMNATDMNMGMNGDMNMDMNAANNMGMNTTNTM